MKRSMAAAFAAASLCLTGVASAQPMGPGGGWPLDERIGWLAARIDAGAHDGFLSGNEIHRGHDEIAAIRAEEDRLRQRDGGQLSPEDRSYLLHRVDELNQTLRWTGHNPPPPWMSE